MGLATLWLVMAVTSGGYGQSENSVAAKRDQGCKCVPAYHCDFHAGSSGSGVINVKVDAACPDLLDVCCPVDQIHTDTKTATVVQIKKDSPKDIETRIDSSTSSDVDVTKFYCGVSNIKDVSFRVTGGGESQYGQFPWMAVVVGEGRKYLCGGSLIHPQVVLTAAHCVNRSQDLTVRLGEWDVKSKNEPEPVQNIGVREVILHDQFKAGTLYNDIALLFLDSAAKLGGSVGTVCLPEPNEAMEGRTCISSGWGKDAFQGKHATVLNSVEIPVLYHDQCQQALRQTKLGEFFRLHISFLCAGGQEGKDTCTGDGGSPLVCPTLENPEAYEQAGIVSWGVECGHSHPSAYTNLALFRSWIDLQLLRHGLIV